jgi:dihydroxy-acid dehydratase
MVLITVLGGSTNAVLHLIAIARSVGINLTLDDMQRVSESRCRCSPTFKPSGQYVMEDLQAVGRNAGRDEDAARRPVFRRQPV